MTQNWQPLTPPLELDWRDTDRTVWFRDAKGQIGFGTFDLAKAMKCNPVEIAEIVDE